MSDSIESAFIQEKVCIIRINVEIDNVSHSVLFLKGMKSKLSKSLNL